MGGVLVGLGVVLICLVGWMNFASGADRPYEIYQLYQLSLVLLQQNALPILIGVMLIGFGGVIAAVEDLQKHLRKN
jgi:hypothetical protein